MVVTPTKQELRDEIRKRLRSITFAQRTTWSARVLEQFCSLPEIQAAQTVFIFASLPTEIDTNGIFLKLREMNKCIAMPYVAPGDKHMKPYVVESLNDLGINAMGFRQCIKDNAMQLDAKSIDIAVMPGLAFDRKGHRLGRGKGVYDEFLKNQAPTAWRLGLFYSLQEVPTIPVTVRDQPMDCVITEKEIFRYALPTPNNPIKRRLFVFRF